MKLDIEKWNEVRKQLEANIKAMKHSIRRVEKPIMTYQQIGVHEEGSWKGRPKYDFRPTGDMYRGGTSNEYYSLEDMKKRATSLYALRAALRDKVHCETWTKEDLLEQVLPSYSIPDDEEKAA